MVLVHHSLEGILDQVLLIIAEDTGHDRLTNNQETMDGEEEGMVLYILLVEAFILHHILLHPEEIQGPVTIIDHIVGEEDLEIGRIEDDLEKGRLKEDSGIEFIIEIHRDVLSEYCIGL